LGEQHISIEHGNVECDRFLSRPGRFIKAKMIERLTRQLQLDVRPHGVPSFLGLEVWRWDDRSSGNP